MKFEIKDKDLIKILDFLHLKNRRFRSFVAIIEEMIFRLEKNHTFLIAAGIAFNILLYLIPLLLVALYIVNVTIGADMINDLLLKGFDQVIPSTPILEDVLENVLNEVSLTFNESSLFGILGIITLLWLSTTLLSSLRTGLNSIFKIETPRTYFFYKLLDVLLIISLAILIMLITFVSPLVSVIQSYIVQLSPDYLAPIFNKAYILLFSIFNSLLLFYLLFRFVPNKKMPRIVRYTSIISCVVFVEISRYIFAWYIGGVSAYGKFYGTYAILASMAVWVYYLTFIILFSAEIGKLVYDIRNKVS